MWKSVTDYACSIFKLWKLLGVTDVPFLTSCCQFCRHVQSLGPTGHQGWDHKAVSRWREELQNTGNLTWDKSKDCLLLVALCLLYHCTHTFRDGECRGPLWSENIQTDAAVTVDIWVVNSCCECNLRRVKQKIKNAGCSTMLFYNKLALHLISLLQWLIFGLKHPLPLFRSHQINLHLQQ